MTPNVLLSDEIDRQIIRDALDDTVIVEAAAGTGKTTALVNRILKRPNGHDLQKELDTTAVRVREIFLKAVSA